MDRIGRNAGHLVPQREKPGAGQRQFLAVQEEFGTFDRYIWQFVGGQPLPGRHATTSKESDAMSKDMKSRGFTFVGSTICYAYMQAAGMVNDHFTGCFRHAELCGQQEV